jgi:adenylate cyclase
MNWKQEKFINALLCTAVSLLWLSAYVVSYLTASEEFYSPLFKLENISEDFRSRYGRQAEPSDQLVFIGIDKQSYVDEIWPDEIAQSEALKLITEQKYPWSRKIWGLLAERLIAQGTDLIIFDFIFPHETDGDEYFQKIVSQHRDKIILGANIGGRKVHNQTGGSDIKIIWPNDSVTGDYEASKSQVGLVNFWIDPDGTARRLTFNYALAGEKIPTLLTSTARLLHIDHPLLDSSESFRFRFTGAPQSVFKFHPIYELFVPGMWESNYANGAYFQGKIVMVGPAANWTQDLHKTPYDQRMFGPELHLNAINALLQNELIYDTSPPFNILIIIGAGILGWGLVTFFQSALRRSLVFLSIAAIYLIVGWLIYNHGSTMLLLVTPVCSFLSVGAACMIYQFILESIERAKTRSNFEQYVSQNVVKLMLDSSDFKEVLKGVRRPCTILFSDIRGFTTITETADSHQLVAQLNEYFTEMVDCVFKYNGTLDKFIGDAVMAVWGNATTNGPQKDAIDSVHSALQMLDDLEKLNARWKSEGRQELAIGIGLNHGQVIVGDMGSPKKKEFTVIGDAVNLASRIEGTTKKYGLQLVIGEQVATLVENEFILQRVDLIQVKGKTEPVKVFTVLADKTKGIPEDQAAGLQHYHQGMDAFLKADFSEAEKLFTKAKTQFTRNALPDFYIERCQQLRQSPPPENWDGVVILTEK